MSRLLKYNPFASTVNGLLVDLAAPCNLSYGWNFGSLLGVCLVVQLLSGVWLSFHYSSSVLFAFDSVEHIMRDV
jgi:ubiquinol-cytochrome c reductase cytochrome b subunit